MEETLLIQQCKEGSRKAQKLLYDAYADNMFLLCIRYVRDHHHAEELMMGGFYQFYKKIDQFEFRGKGSIKAWLKKIMVNECLMFLRRNDQIRFIEEKNAAESIEQTDILQQLNAKELFCLIEDMPDGYRTVFNLYAVEGYTHQEIGALLGISEGTSKSQLSKARKLLQTKIEHLNNNKWNIGKNHP